MGYETHHSKDIFQRNLEVLRNNLPSDYELNTDSDDAIVITRQKLEMRGSNGPKQGGSDLPRRHPRIGPVLLVRGTRQDYATVTYALTLSLDENGVPKFEKKSEIENTVSDGSVWDRTKEGFTERSFEVTLSGNRLRLVIENTYYYFENKNGKLVLTDIR